MKIYRTIIDHSPTQKPAAAELAADNICVLPNRVEIAKGDIATFAGFPTGQHHVLVKAAEARLAVEQGARLVIVVPASLIEHELLTEVVTLRQAVAHPATLAVALDTRTLDDATTLAAAEVIRNGGADAVCSGIYESRPTAHTVLGGILPLIAIGPTPDHAVGADIWLATGQT